MAETTIDLATVGMGLADPVFDAQAVFNEVMWAMSRPGLPRRIEAPCEPPAGLDAAATLTLLTLADFETPVWLPPALRAGPAGAALRFHAGCPLVEDPATAMFLVADGADAAAVIASADIGEERYPDRAATVILTVPALVGGLARTITGPGVEGALIIAPQGLDAAAWAAIAANHRHYPLGVDILLTSGRDILALPRGVAPGAGA